MAITTFYSVGELKSMETLDSPYPSDLPRLYQEVRAINPNLYIRCSRPSDKSSFFTRFHKPPLYQLLYLNDIRGQVQIYNFPGKGINTDVTEEFIITYLLGYLNGNFDK